MYKYSQLTYEHMQKYINILKCAKNMKYFLNCSKYVH